MNIPINVPDGQSGDWKIKTFIVDEEGAKMHNLKEIMKGGKRFITPGTYKQLIRFDHRLFSTIVMSNTPAEIADHTPFIQRAEGNVLIFGLGLGLVVQALIDKPQVKRIKIIDSSEDVIKLSGNYYKSISDKVEIILEDAFTYDDNEFHDCIWFDIWDDITSENLPEMKQLKKKWKGKCNYIGFWAEKECKHILKIEKEEERFQDLRHEFISGTL